MPHKTTSVTIDTHMQIRRLLILLSASVVVAVAVFIFATGYGQLAFNQADIESIARSAGWFGPLALIVFMALAIVVSPIPSGPIAMAAGALYGAPLGAAISVVGAEIGAIAAFLISRLFGSVLLGSALSRLPLWVMASRTPGALMWIVFASRLIPFISFDLVSYAAGLTQLSLLRFAIATLAGVIPMAFLFAAMGAGLSAAGEGNKLLLAASIGITLLCPLVVYFRRR